MPVGYVCACGITCGVTSSRIDQRVCIPVQTAEQHGAFRNPEGEIGPEDYTATLGVIGKCARQQKSDRKHATEREGGKGGQGARERGSERESARAREREDTDGVLHAIRIIGGSGGAHHPLSSSKKTRSDR